MRRTFVAVVATTAGSLVAATAAANPPAPSSVPDPIKLVSPTPGEHPHRLRRHDGGCFAHYASGGVTRADCPAVLDKAGEEIEREPTTGECVLIEPWADEPKETECPAVLVPEGWVSTKKTAAPPKASPPPASLETPQASSSACARSCNAAGATASSLGALAGVGSVALAVARRRRKR